jgi:hypothetical protein
MRAREFLLEKIGQNQHLSQLKKEIVAGVKNTNDIDLLDKIKNTLYSSDITTKITNALGTDSDAIQLNIDTVSKILLDLPGTSQDKLDFINGYPNGYIDVDLLLSGNRVHFEDLIKLPPGVSTNAKAVALKFMHALAKFQPQDKGPGEFSIAILSPQIKIDGAGDFKIGDKKIEVKASTSSGGGTLGQGNLQVANIPAILSKHIPNFETKVPGNLSISGLKKLLQSPDVTAEMKTNLAAELWPYMFNHSNKVNYQELTDATLNPANLDRAYVKASWSTYQFLKGNKKGFDGVLLMSFKLNEIQYFEDPDELAKNITPIDSQIIGTQASRGAPARVTMARQTVEKPTLKKGLPEKELSTALLQQAKWLINNANAPGSLTEPVHRFLMDKWKAGVAPTNLAKQTIEAFPRLKVAPGSLRS